MQKCYFTLKFLRCIERTSFRLFLLMCMVSVCLSCGSVQPLQNHFGLVFLLQYFFETRLDRMYSSCVAL